MECGQSSWLGSQPLQALSHYCIFNKSINQPTILYPGVMSWWYAPKILNKLDQFLNLSEDFMYNHVTEEKGINSKRFVNVQKTKK